MQALRRHPATHGSAGKAKLAELRHSDHAVLTSGELINAVLQPTGRFRSPRVLF
jgi:hypothetical protein